jgi:mannose-1-phosphate guanylyltransferase
MKAMILAAGLGTRLLPYTLKRPKPLFPVLNRPLLSLTLSRIKSAGFTEIVVNAYHLRDQIKEAIQLEQNIVLQEETIVLGTGGGLRLALPNFGQDPFLVVNGDIYHTIDYRRVYDFHCKHNADVTLVVHDYPRFNNIMVDDEGCITAFNTTGEHKETTGRVLAFTGIHVINPEVLQAVPLDTNSCIIDHYKNLLAQGITIRACQSTDHFWTDMGTPADYLKLHGDLLNGKTPVYEELTEAIASAPFVCGKNISLDRNVRLLDWACIGRGATIGPGATLQRCVVWDDAVIPGGSTIKDAIVTS